MKQKHLVLLFAVMLVIAGLASAQQRSRSRAVRTPAGPQSVISGAVVSFTATAGHGMPTLVVRQGSSDVSLVLGPFRLLQDAKFAATAGDVIEATVMACPDCASGYAVISVRNITNGTSVAIRNADGLPLWSGAAPGFGNGGGRGPGNRPGNGPNNGHGSGYGPGSGPNGGECNGTGPDMTKLATFSGAVTSFTGGLGAGRPTLVLATPEGDKTFIVAPYRVVYESGFEFVSGVVLSLTAVPNTEGEWVVVTLKDPATGAEIILRDANGIPIGRF